MSFTSAMFLIVFFPISILLGYLAKDKSRNICLCIISALFYFWCGIKFLLLIVISATLAYGFGKLIERSKDIIVKRIILIVSILYNLGVLFFYKYLFDLFPDVSYVFAELLEQNVQIIQKPALPLGISFYTFSILSYILDVYWGKCKAQSLLNIYLYVMFFPKVVQGPIMKYCDFEKQLNDREINITKLNLGFERFIKGMVKKVMIADQLQPLVSYSFLNISNIGTMPAWIGAIAYLLQLYYDFSGYSDMAIGLGYMYGFEFPENFDHPYMSSSIGEFWRRWHASLGEWFKEYIYIPVSRILINTRLIKNFRHPMLLCDILSLLCVWILTGIWHGSGAKFFVWGIWYFGFIAFERIRDFYRKEKRKKKKIKSKKLSVSQKVFDRTVVAFGVIFGQIIFKADSLYTVILYWKKMFTWSVADGLTFLNQFDNYMLFALIIGVLFSFPLFGYIKKYIVDKNILFQILYKAVLIMAAIVAFCYSVSAGYSAFLYEVF